VSGSDCLHRGSDYPLESRNRLTRVGKASSTPYESLPSGGLGGMKKSKVTREPLLSGSPDDMNSPYPSDSEVSTSNNCSSNKIVVGTNSNIGSTRVLRSNLRVANYLEQSSNNAYDSEG
jgi:hypothetical protein